MNINQRIADQPTLVRLLWVAIGSAVFVLVLFPIILKVSFMQPLQRLMLGIQRANDGDLSVQVATDTLDEIGIVTQHFNHMTQSLKLSKDELIAHAETLEQRVTERTAQLNQSLTELRDTQAQLIQREKLASLGELTAGIAHEIQNPLNFVNNFSEVSVDMLSELKEEASAGQTSDVLAIADELSQNLQKITYHGRRASAIVRGMLEHSRTSTGEHRPTDINTLANEYFRLAYQGLRRPGSSAKDQEFTCELITNFDPELGKVKVAPQELGRVLLNLYNNAFYAVRERQKTGSINYVPSVSVSTAQVGRYVEIRVRDNGIGMPELVKTKIFQPFFTTKPTGEGTGLGLSLSYDIITKGHGGTLTVESREGEETVFCITLPGITAP